MSDDRDMNQEVGDLGDLVENLFDDVERVKKMLDRAFPGSSPAEEEVRARRDKLRRAQVEPGLERVHTNALEAPEHEKEAALIQEEARGKHTLYAITARHHRLKPFDTDWTGRCQAVRVSLPATPENAEPIWTYLGVVKQTDHLAFSVQEIADGYAAAFGARPEIARVDLITGARHYDLDRFSPISVFLAYTREDDTIPCFYVYESGSAQGEPAKLYWGRDLDYLITESAGFRFTPFARLENTYRGKLIMNRARTEPSMVSISICLGDDRDREYMNLSASYEVVQPGPVIWPITVQIQAAMRVFAIAQGMGCNLELWEWGLGQLARTTLEWFSEPPQRGTNRGYSECGWSP
ncbi:hypothetical protein G6O69_28975 [Pseudenhygromyxa sp. WMMC2535]|uniref:DUF1365 family protein n=1 Tax=Pseudenhygromyxa sp. WMMC2535 TaxID=2712867 RepID=UPI001557B560|nr:DUF1365 family protein [Pseudenhygromyxa sp. WMMC2535]NVB41899.1 hypothetical protein [Pseudenhygromyxa sp. WMMC2535]